MVSTTNTFDDIANVFYDLIEDNVNSITLNNGTTVSVKNHFFTFPDKEFTSKDEFPIICIESDDAFDETFVYNKDELTSRIRVEVYSTSTESMLKLIGACYNIIKSNTSTLFDEGITKVRLVDKDTDKDKFGSIKIRKGLLVFEVTNRRTL